MGGTSSAKSPKEQPAVREYIHAVTDERRALFDKLQALILEMYPECDVLISYGVPTYRAKSGRVGLGYWSGGVSFYPFGGGYLDEFRPRYPAIKTRRGTINFKTSEEVPVGALKKVIRRSIEHPMH